MDAGTGTEFNPTIAWETGSGALGIGYYSTEGDQNTGNYDVRPRMALSTDNGNTWSRTFLSTQTSNEAGGYGGDYLEYNGFTFRDGTAHYLWASRDPTGGTDLDAFTTSISLDCGTNNNVLSLGARPGETTSSSNVHRQTATTLKCSRTASAPTPGCSPPSTRSASRRAAASTRSTWTICRQSR